MAAVLCVNFSRHEQAPPFHLFHHGCRDVGGDTCVCVRVLQRHFLHPRRNLHTELRMFLAQCGGECGGFFGLAVDEEDGLLLAGDAVERRRCSDSLLVGIVSADEEPDDGAVFFDAEGAVAVVNANRPIGTDALEVKRRMPMILLPEFILLFRARLDARGQAVEPVPELRRDG